MSDVIRQAVIELTLRLKKEGLDGGSGGLNKFYEQQTKAAKEAEKQTQQKNRTMRESAHVHEEFGRRSALAFAHAGHGALQLTRGIALLAASGEGDTKKLLENLVKIEGAVSVARGAANLARLAAEFGPVGVAVSGVAATV